MFKWLKNIFKNRECHTIWGIRLYSHDDVLYKNVITIFLGYYIRSFTLPFNIIKPIIDYHVYKKDINDNDMPDIMATAYSINVYGLTFLSNLGYFEFNWNYADDIYTNITNHKGISKIIYLFWRYKTKVKTILLNLDNTSFSDITDSTDANIDYLTTLQPRYYISIMDNEGNNLLAECRAKLTVYTYGGSLLTKLIMSIFKRPETIRRVIIDIPEISYSSILDMYDDETIMDSFRRYCNQFNYIFISIIEKG